MVALLEQGVAQCKDTLRRTLQALNSTSLPALDEYGAQNFINTDDNFDQSDLSDINDDSDTDYDDTFS